MTKLKIILALSALVLLPGCGIFSPAVKNYSDLSACGSFPATSGDGGPTSRYFVCRSAKTGDCYYKKAYQAQVPGCDPEFDKNPYGKEECFENKADFYGWDGKVSESGAGVREKSGDACGITTQDYFESKTGK
jgi:hypothetical protein